MKKSYQLFLLACLSLCCFFQALAQSSTGITGTLVDSKGEPLSYGTVALIRKADAAVVDGAGVEVNGHFKLKSPAPGTYFLKVTAMGYGTLETPAFVVNQAGFQKEFGKLALAQDAKMLQEVTVESMRPTIINHPDKMVVSVEGTVMAAGSTAMEVLSKSPGVWVDQDGNIQLNGKAGVRVMIDGKLTYMSGKQLQTMLQSMPADNIKDLEIITNPSSKFDAEGNSGIININLKKNQMTGLNGSVYTGYQYNKLHGYSAGTNINYKSGKWNSFLNADFGRRPNLRTNTMTRLFLNEGQPTSFDQRGREETFRNVPSVRLGTDYQLNDQHSFGAMAYVMTVDYDNSFVTETYLRNSNPLEDSLISARNLIDADYFNITLNGHYAYKLDTLGSSLTADVDYVKITDNNDAGFFNSGQYVNQAPQLRLEQLGSYNPTTFHIYSAKADFTRKFQNKSKLEAGLKASYVESDNELQFYFVEGNSRRPDSKRSNHFIYRENIYAGYANYSANLGERWSVQAGLRAEQTVSKGRSVTLKHTTPRRYLDFFPSLFVQQKVTDNYQLTYNYSRRINRPQYDDLNPFIFYLDPLTWAQGNPALRPQYTHSFQVSQTFKKDYILTLGYAHTKDFIAEIPVQNNETNTTIFSQRNVDAFKNLNGTLVVPVRIMKKWEASNNLGFGFQSFTTYVQENQPILNEQIYYMLNSNHTLQLPHKIKMELNLGLQGPQAYGLYTIERTWWLDSGVKRSFLKDNLDVSLTVTDIFRTRKVVGSANFDGNINAFDQYFAAQSFRVNLRYRFSKGQKFEMQRRSTNLEELNRAGGN
ncbi:TonB-dependent receptor domain-containing protein [Rufibacter ruber]|uniref:TonB-dependent receptor domain-containing protein n=1 Tax=Rufibacter ruber TaxID=1783499 RepID=UPI00082D2BA0|nr:TonB-dependent receptor [Rufibacter ruber]